MRDDDPGGFLPGCAAFLLGPPLLLALLVWTDANPWAFVGIVAALDLLLAWTAARSRYEAWAATAALFSGMSVLVLGLGGVALLFLGHDGLGLALLGGAAGGGALLYSFADAIDLPRSR